MQTIALTRAEMDKLIEFVTHFKNINWFQIQQSHESGIGSTTVVRCSLFGNDSEPETTVDITDVSVW